MCSLNLYFEWGIGFKIGLFDGSSLFYGESKRDSKMYSVGNRGME